MPGSYQGITDRDLPEVPKPSLQQYNNEQNYDICCVDVWFETTDERGQVSRSDVTKQLSFLAIQAYGILPITSDFMEIALEYK
jgi:hypothetical protein